MLIKLRMWRRTHVRLRPDRVTFNLFPTFRRMFYFGRKLSSNQRQSRYNVNMSISIFLIPFSPFLMRPAVLHKKGRLSTTPILLSASAVTTGTNLIHQFVSKVTSNFWNHSPPPSLPVFVCHCLACKSFPLNSWLCPYEMSTCRIIPPPSTLG